MDDEGTDITGRMGKLDSLLLWVASLSSPGFSLFIVYLKMPLIPYIPIFALIGTSIIIGYVNGAVLSDSFTERIRGWNYLLLGLSFYIPSAIAKFGEPIDEKKVKLHQLMFSGERSAGKTGLESSSVPGLHVEYSLLMRSPTNSSARTL